MNQDYKKKPFGHSVTVYCLLFYLLLNIWGAKAQTTHIDPVTGGGFESGTTFTANGWTATGSATTTFNQWVCNTGATAGFSGTNAAYISNNTAGAPPPQIYTHSARVSHIYRNITVVAGETNIYLNFKWMGQGETNFDYMTVWLVPTSFTPVYGTAVTATGSAPTGRILQGLAQYKLQGTWRMRLKLQSLALMQEQLSDWFLNGKTMGQEGHNHP